MNLSRRGLIGMLAAGVGAAIVRPGLVMPIKPVRPVLDGARLAAYLHRLANPPLLDVRQAISETIFYGDDSWNPREFSGFEFLRRDDAETVWLRNLESKAAS